MSPIKKELYKYDLLPEDEKSSVIPNLIKTIKERNLEDQKEIAEYVKRYLQGMGKWKFKKTDISNPNKRNKNAEKVVTICHILELDYPVS